MTQKKEKSCVPGNRQIGRLWGTRSIRLTAWLFIACLVSATAAVAVEKSPSTENVAVVNGVSIKRKDFQKELNAVEKHFATQGNPISSDRRTELKDRIVQNMIDQELLYQESQKQKIAVESSEVDASLENLKKNYKDEAEYAKGLKEMDVSEKDLLLKIKRILAVQKLLETQVGRKIKISEKESKFFYTSHPDYFKIPEQVKASHILIKLAPEADVAKKNEAKSKIEEIQKQLAKGGDFASLAKQYSEGPSNKRGGELGYFSRGQMVKPFETAAFSLNVGKISEIVETKFGFHLIHVTDKKPATNVEYKEAKQKIVQFLKREKGKREIPLYLKGIREKATIEKLP